MYNIFWVLKINSFNICSLYIWFYKLSGVCGRREGDWFFFIINQHITSFKFILKICSSFTECQHFLIFKFRFLQVCVSSSSSLLSSSLELLPSGFDRRMSQWVVMKITLLGSKHGISVSNWSLVNLLNINGSYNIKENKSPHFNCIENAWHSIDLYHNI